jgi:uncharacterized protein YutE (UPF0331/DUF86 family)
MNDIVINKIQSIQRCCERAREEYSKNPSLFSTDFTLQDSAVLNIIRACEQAIDLANHIIKDNRYGIPTSSAESFELLEKKKIISGDLAEKLINMTKFRNIVIHSYQQVKIEIVKSVILNDLNDLLSFAEKIKNQFL